jgi:single-stranded-DNA-specific exonuclease
LADLPPPEGLPNAAKAAERLARALRAGEPIAVCGDYDVDGMTGTALLVRFLRLMGGTASWSIPERERDGYGLSPAVVDRMAQEGARVLVTVDNGITAFDALERARDLGLSVIVTDHHLPGDRLPPAEAIVNPHLPAEGTHDAGANADESPDAPPCGCALAFKLAWAVADRMRGRALGAQNGAIREFLKDAVGLVALATVADVVALRGENRVLVEAGLRALRASTHPGVQALLDSADLGDLPLTTQDVSFKIAPRLNAAGRLSRPGVVVDLLTETDPLRARRLAQELESLNRTRRSVEQGVLREAEAQAATLFAERPRSALVLYDHGWHVGVVGIVAARLADRYQVPTVVIGFDGELGRGSCRTVPDVNVHAALSGTAEHLLGYGGHAQAAGLEIHHARAAAFRAAFEGVVAAQTGGRDLGRPVEIDAEAPIDAWTEDLVRSVRRLEPFGAGNPEPAFLVREARVAGTPRLIGSGSRHLSFALKQAAGAIRVVAFGRADLHDLVASGEPLDLVVTPMLNEWRGTVTPELRLVDLRAHRPATLAEPAG